VDSEEQGLSVRAQALCFGFDVLCRQSRPPLVLSMKKISPHLEILPPAQRQLWRELDQVPSEFTLYGGTAIALHLGHRQSGDFDFFGNRSFDAAILQATIPFLAEAKTAHREKNTLTAILNRGSEVTVSFFGVPNLPRLVSPLVSVDNGLKIASLLDLAGTKASVVQLRAEAKDYVDLDALITKGGITLPMALAAGQALYGPSFNPQITLKSLSYFDDGDLRSLPEESKMRLVTAARNVDLDHLPIVSQLIRGDTREPGMGL
jgi:Nucleotidyl transferase AbiEii toxin, Type IV TA system